MGGVIIRLSYYGFKDMKMVSINRFFGLAMVLALANVQPALASTSVGASRIIFNADESSKSVDINNTSTAQPYLIKIDISSDISGKAVGTPFVVTPALARIEPGTTNKVRILKASGSLPNDRESVFYFNSMAIPTSKVGNAQSSTSLDGALQIATGNTVKLFYRPGNLGMTQKEAMGKLQFTSDGKGTKVSNPTPYYISISKLIIAGTSVKLDVMNGSSMIAPFGSHVYSVNAARGNVVWNAINDFGAMERFDGAIN